MAGAQVEFMMTPFVDQNGDPLDSGTVEFFIAGTSTPQSVYADKDLGTNLGTSVTLDSRGIKLCFVEGDNFLKIVVKDSAGNTLYTYDGLSYRGGLTDAALYYLLDGTNALTGNMNVNGYNLNNAGDVTIGTGKRLILNHGGTYSPTSTDMVVLKDPSAIYRNYTLNGNLYWYKSGVEKLRLENAAFYSLVDFNVTGSLTVSGAGSIGGALNMNSNKITSLSQGTTSGDAVNYDQWSSQSSSIQTELDTTQAGAGLNTDGTYTPDPTADYISGASSLKNADSLLDDQVKVNTDKGNSLQSELDTTQVGAGLNTDGTYPVDGGSNYLLAATSLHNADSLLDAQIKSNTDDISSLGTRVDDLDDPITGHANRVDNPHLTTLTLAGTAEGGGYVNMQTTTVTNSRTPYGNVLHGPFYLAENSVGAKSTIDMIYDNGSTASVVAQFSRALGASSDYTNIASTHGTIALGVPSAKNIAMSGGRITGLGTPLVTTDSVNKAYADGFEVFGDTNRGHKTTSTGEATYSLLLLTDTDANCEIHLNAGVSSGNEGIVDIGLNRYKGESTIGYTMRYFKNLDGDSGATFTTSGTFTPSSGLTETLSGIKVVIGAFTSGTPDTFTFNIQTSASGAQNWAGTFIGRTFRQT